MATDVRHQLFLGRTGSGKTFAAILSLLCIIEATLESLFKPWIIAVFPHPEPGEFFVSQLYARHGKDILRRMIVEYIKDMHQVVMRDFIKFSTAADIYLRLMENDELCMSFMDMLARGRNFVTGWLEHPVLLKYAKLAVQLCQNQNVWTSQSLLPESLVPKSGPWCHYIDHCTSPRLRAAFLRMLSMTPRDQLTLLEPAQRLLEQFLSSPPIAARTSRPATFHRANFLNSGGIYVILGGNCSEDALRILVGADFQETMFLCRNRIVTTPGYFVIDEAFTYRLAGLPEAKALATMRAFGMNIWLISTTMDMGYEPCLKT